MFETSDGMVVADPKVEVYKYLMYMWEVAHIQCVVVENADLSFTVQPVRSDFMLTTFKRNPEVTPVTLTFNLVSGVTK